MQDSSRKPRDAPALIRLRLKQYGDERPKLYHCSASARHDPLRKNRALQLITATKSRMEARWRPYSASHVGAPVLHARRPFSPGVPHAPPVASQKHKQRTHVVDVRSVEGARDGD